MTFETKESVLEKILSEEKPKCKHCEKEMQLWEVPPVPMGDGLGWGEPYLYVCFNDECPLYVKGWDNIKENYAYNASYRCICYPSNKIYECMPVFSHFGGQGQVVDEQLLAEQAALKEATKIGFSVLAGCYTEKDWLNVLKILLDATQPARVRLKAAEMIGDIGDIEVIDPIKNQKFGNELIEEELKKAIKKIHERHFTKECPFCAEIIKNRAKVCKHCGKDL